MIPAAVSRPMSGGTRMDGPLMTSLDSVRAAIADRIHELGGTEQVVNDIALAAAYAVWCTSTNSL